MWLLLSMLLAGVSLCIGFYLMLSPGIQQHSIPLVVSPYFQRYRWCWPWVNKFSLIALPFCSWKYQKRLSLLLQQAGLEEEISLHDIVGLQVLFSLCVPLFLGWVLVGTLSQWWLFVFVILLISLIGAYLPLMHLKRVLRQRQRLLLKDFPFLLDMTTLCVESGMNLHSALIVATQSLVTGPLKRELSHALNLMRTGSNRADALKELAKRMGLAEVNQWVASMTQAESLGMSIGPTLRAQSEQFRQERFFRAEKKATEAPVKMLFPLVIFIFPCTFIVLIHYVVTYVSRIGMFE